MYKVYKVRKISDFSSEITEARGQWHNIFNVLKVEKRKKRLSIIQPRIFYQAQLHSKIEDKKELLSNKQKLEEFKSTGKSNYVINCKNFIIA